MTEHSELPVLLDALAAAAAVPLSAAGGLERIEPEVATAQRSLLSLAPLRPPAALAAYTFAWEAASGARAPLLLQLRVNGEDFELSIDAPSNVPALDAVLQPALPPALRTAGMAHLAQPTLNALAVLLGARVELKGAGLSTGVSQGPAIGFVIEPGAGEPWRGWVRPARRNGWRWLVRTSQALMQRREPPAFRLGCHPVLGISRVALRDLGDLVPEDVVVVQRSPSTPGGLQCWLTVGDNRRVLGRAAVQSGALVVVSINRDKETIMGDEIAPGTAVPLAASADEIEVAVRFELMPWRTTLDELRTLAPGSVIDTANPVGEADVSLWVERNCIGVGRLVAVGDRLGVRVHELWARQGQVSSAGERS